MRRIWVLAVLAGAIGSPALAQQAGGQESPPVTAVGNLQNGHLGVGLGGPGGPSQPAPTSNAGTAGTSGPTQVIPVSARSGSGSGGTQAPPPVAWARHYLGDASDPGYGVNSPIVCQSSTGQKFAGRPYEDVGTDRATGQVVARQTGCENPAAPTQPGTGATNAPPPPAPPTPAEIWAHVPLPTPVLALNPSINGLTGLPTWLWDPNGGAPVNGTVNLRGYTATATASPIHWEWRMWRPGDTPNVNPSPIVVADRSGTEARPAGTYMYETRGDYTVTLTVTWAGTYTYAGNGVGPAVNNLGSDTKTSTQAYHVISIRGARIG